MKFEVVKSFRDKNTNELYTIGDEYKTNSVERAEHLKTLGYIAGEIEDKQELNLTQNANEVISAINGDLGEETLELLLKEEQEGKKRSTVIKHIESLLKGDDDESEQS